MCDKLLCLLLLCLSQVRDYRACRVNCDLGCKLESELGSKLERCNTYYTFGATGSTFVIGKLKKEILWDVSVLNCRQD